MEGDEFEEIRSKFYYPRLNLPKGCTCVMYALETMHDAVIFLAYERPLSFGWEFDVYACYPCI